MPTQQPELDKIYKIQCMLSHNQLFLYNKFHFPSLNRAIIFCNSSTRNVVSVNINKDTNLELKQRCQNLFHNMTQNLHQMDRHMHGPSMYVCTLGRFTIKYANNLNT